MSYLERVKSFFPPLFSTSSRSLIYSTERMFCLHMPIQVDGWTHEKLCALDIPLERLQGADAYLGDTWVGSTEV
ncbi:conserved hypothetical protein (plasmid) [Aeromonas salmonicida subsp. salmonicida A449]|uniref:Uncharacterized protein n=1 Tax=Aeromonas salmonicida (strain A449) TaxID=382245 RepID=A4SU53_AERS4|nr:conserved hypothetical protein [Aeromonas salmonicida subsp. salmonicida A449]